MNSGVNIHIILVHKSLIDKPKINRCWGLLLLNADLVICDIIISDPMADKVRKSFAIQIMQFGMSLSCCYKAQAMRINIPRTFVAGTQYNNVLSPLTGR